MNEFLLRISISSCKIAKHIQNMLESVFGYLLFSVSMVSGFIVGEKVAFTIIGLAVFCDFILGIATSLKNKKFGKSRLVQDTFIKIIVYGIPLVLVGLSGKMFHDWNIVFYALCALATACELWSITAHLLILAPNMPFLKLLRFQLQDEIKSKTGKDISDIQDETE